MDRLFLALSLLLLTYPRAGIAADNKPQNLSLHDLSGKKVQLRSYRGSIVVLNFWATWCGPCREEMPRIGAAEREWAPKGIIFIAISLDEKRTMGKIPSFLEKSHAELPVWTGASVDDLEKLHLGRGIPDTVFLDKNGMVVFRVLGEIRHAELEERLNWLTSERKAPPPAAIVHHM